LYISTLILNCKRWRTGSQCSSCKLDGREVLAPFLFGDKACCGVLGGLYRRRYSVPVVADPVIVSCNSPGVLKWTPVLLATWRHQTTASVSTGAIACS